MFKRIHSLKKKSYQFTTVLKKGSKDRFFNSQLLNCWSSSRSPVLNGAEDKTTTAVTTTEGTSPVLHLPSFPLPHCPRFLRFSRCSVSVPLLRPTRPQRQQQEFQLNLLLEATKAKREWFQHMCRLSRLALNKQLFLFLSQFAIWLRGTRSYWVGRPLVPKVL